ncbi:STAS domain-containing protein [Streptomyces sp. CRN 30]|uniref:STAS domain-containing protein n=1 Tax=Streptomyces sp. CRN 30 TaxID=3075613 RepID=UPI002A83C8C3|nr:STAS domain-containing protein [Streptomyces sp. CRN 30]
MPPEAQDRAAPPSGDATAGPGLAPPNPHAHSRRTGTCTVIEVTGEIDVATADQLAEHLRAAVALPGPDIVVDLRGVDFFDCSGLRVLCRAETLARARDGRLRLVCDQPGIHRILRATGLLDRFPPLRELPPPALTPEPAPELIRGPADSPTLSSRPPVRGPHGIPWPGSRSPSASSRRTLHGIRTVPVPQRARALLPEGLRTRPEGGSGGVRWRTVLGIRCFLLRSVGSGHRAARESGTRATGGPGGAGSASASLPSPTRKGTSTRPVSGNFQC